MSNDKQWPPQYLIVWDNKTGTHRMRHLIAIIYSIIANQIKRVVVVVKQNVLKIHTEIGLFGACCYGGEEIVSTQHLSNHIYKSKSLLFFISLKNLFSMSIVDFMPDYNYNIDNYLMIYLWYSVEIISVHGRKLKRLNLGGNELTSVPQRALSIFDNLKKLEIQENKIRVIKEGDFEGKSRTSILWFRYLIFCAFVHWSTSTCVFPLALPLLAIYLIYHTRPPFEKKKKIQISNVKWYARFLHFLP